MKIFLASMLLLQCLLNEARANLDGQTSERVPLLNEDGSATGTTITCSPYSVENEIYEVEYVKYVLDTEEEANSTVVWDSQSNLTLFKQCASYAAEQNVGMFYFDGQTCETSDTVYERKEKTCNSTAAKMVYMQIGFQPAATTTTTNTPTTTICIEDGITHNEGEQWAVYDLPCGAIGRKTCVNGVIIPERSYYQSGNEYYTSHVEGVDYFKLMDDVCFIKPVLSTGKPDVEGSCSTMEAHSCSPITIGINSTFFTEKIKEFLDSSVVNSMETSQLTVPVFRNPGSIVFTWQNDEDYPFDFPATSNPSKTCIVFDTENSNSPSASDCNTESTRDICCMIKMSPS